MYEAGRYMTKQVNPIARLIRSLAANFRGEPQTNHLPLASIVLSYRRPFNMRKIIRTLSGISEQVYVWNNNPDEFISSKAAICINASMNFGMYPRFAVALLVGSDAVWVQDDDLLVPRETVARIYEHWNRAPDKVHGLLGRLPDANGNYVVDDVFGPCKIVIGRGIMFHRNLAVEFFKLASDPRIASVRKLCLQLGTIEHNGDDIMLSYAALLAGAENNMAYQLPYTDMDSRGSVSSHPAHLQVRTAMMQTCQEILTERHSALNETRVPAAFRSRR